MENSNYTITKCTVECYKIRKSTGLWADINIDEEENTGRIQIASDYGSWQYYWGPCGKSFKKFLIGLDIGYASGKFGESDWFDLDATIKYLKNRIDEYGFDDDEKESVLNELNELTDVSCKEEFVHIVSNCDLIMNMEDGMPNMCKNISPTFKNFWETIWQVFINELKKELDIVS